VGCNIFLIKSSATTGDLGNALVVSSMWLILIIFISKYDPKKIPNITKFSVFFFFHFLKKNSPTNQKKQKKTLPISPRKIPQKVPELNTQSTTHPTYRRIP